MFAFRCFDVCCIDAGLRERAGERCAYPIKTAATETVVAFRAVTRQGNLFCEQLTQKH
jgi:hypothetical protein